MYVFIRPGACSLPGILSSWDGCFVLTSFIKACLFIFLKVGHTLFARRLAYALTAFINNAGENNALHPLLQCPSRAEQIFLKSPSEIRGLCGDVVGQDGGFNPSFLLLGPPQRKHCSAEGKRRHRLSPHKCSEPSSVGAYRLFRGINGSPKVGILGSGGVNIL